MRKKIVTIEDEIKSLKNYLYNLSSSENSNNTTSFFKDAYGIYSFTNENLKSTFNLDLTDKKSLVVTSSGDHILHAVLNNSKDITGFDINRFCKFYASLKIAAIKAYTYDKFKRNMIPFIDSGVSNNIKSIYRLLTDVSIFLTYDENKFWEAYYNMVKASKVGATIPLAKHLLICDIDFSNCAYHDFEKYDELRYKLSDANINYIDCDIGSIGEFIDGSFDYIHISNILEYVRSYDIFLKVIYELYEILNKNGNIDVNIGDFKMINGYFCKNIEESIRPLFEIEKIESEKTDSIRFTKK